MLTAAAPAVEVPLRPTPHGRLARGLLMELDDYNCCSL
jgi:hypothetical protein